MSVAIAVLDWLEDKSDWLSPIVVKEVRQTVRGREFHYSFGASLIVALAVAFFGAGTATRSDGTTGAGTFSALMVCLTLLGMLVVPIGAFSAMRTERLEQTLELVTVTALSPRRVVIGKLMAQAVKLVTFFAALAPFMAMSFLLGGIDFFTILLSLAVLFLWSLWAASAFLFLSTLFKSRAMSGVVFGAAGIVLFLFYGMGRAWYYRFTIGIGMSPTGASGSDFWWGLAMMMTGCVATMANLVLLAESRLKVTTDDRVTPLRVGFFVQFMLIVSWALSFITGTPPERTGAAEALGVIGGLHLALVAMFTVTEDLDMPRRVELAMQRPSRWDPLLFFVRPGPGRGAAYVLAQMGILVAAGTLLDASGSELTWRLGICAYICFLSGLPAYVWRRLWPRDSALKVRVVVLLLFSLTLILPDVLYNVLWQPVTLDTTFGTRHLLNPFRTLANWSLVESSGWMSMVAVIGVLGLVTYAGLILMGRRFEADAREPDAAVAAD